MGRTWKGSRSLLAAAMFAAGLMLSTGASALADDWPHWRGPNHNGISREQGWLDQWPQSGPPVVWKASVGTGFSSVAVSQGRLYSMGNQDNTDTVYCLDAATGKPLWKHSYKSDLGDHLFEGGPTATPTIDDGQVYTLGRWGDLFCFDALSGRVLWSKNVQKETNARVPDWGFAGSPLIHDNLLVLNVGKAGTAVEKITGKVVWRSEDEAAGYSTPVPLQRGGDWFALVSSGNAFTAVNIKTGKELWQIRWVTRYGVNAADPILAGDHIFLSSGYTKGAALFKTGERAPAEVWHNKNLRNQFSPSVLLDGFLYGIDGDTTSDAVLKCLELKTGEVRWTQEGVGSGSLMAADGKLIVLTDAGKLMVAKASPEGFTPSAKAQVLEGKCWTVPVLAGGRIYCRNAAGDLVCLDVRTKSGGPKP
jgi:outer membrane protein assembly factor BamB